MFHNYGYEVAAILKKAEKERKSLRHPYVGTEHLVLSILSGDNEVSHLLSEYGITYDLFREELILIVGQASCVQELNLYTPMLKVVIETANMEASEYNKGIVTPSFLFYSVLEEGEGIAYRVLYSLDVPLDEIYSKLKKMCIKKESKYKNLEIYKIGIHFNQMVDYTETVVGREKEISFMIETLLRRQKNNPLLIGKAGVGKTALVEELVRKIKRKEVPVELQNTEIILLEMGSLVAGTKYRGEFEERLHKIIKEVIQQQNIILFIDEIHSMVNAGGAEGAISASDILKPYLARGELKVIGATTLEEYHDYLEKDKALDRRFEKIMILEPDKTNMKNILEALKPSFQKHYKINLTEQNIEDFLDCSEEYIFNKCNPDKTIELMDSVCARVKLKYTENIQEDIFARIKKNQKKKEKFVKLGDFENAKKLAEEIKELEKQVLIPKESVIKITKDDILEMIECKTHALIRGGSKKELLKKLETNLKNNILGQDSVIHKLIDVMSSPKQKGTSFLLVGGSGVGKTETVKIISDTLQTNLLRIDMSEYAQEDSINKLIGSPAGYVGYNDKSVLEVLRENPFTTILFDEIEKAHPKVLNLLLQILDEGCITDQKGNQIYFNHTYIFLTSNAKSKKTVGFAKTNHPTFEGLTKELLGRIDSILEYNSITEDIALKYIERELKNPDIDAYTLLEQSDYEKYGLRNLKNIIHKENKKLEYQES